MPTYQSSSAVRSKSISSDYRIAAFQGTLTNNAHYVWLDPTITYSFPSGPTYFDNGNSYGLKNEVGAGWVPFGSSQQASVRAALQAWADVANVNFVEVDDDLTVGDMRFAYTSAIKPPTLGWAYSPAPDNPVSGDVWITSDWSALAMGNTVSQTSTALLPSYSFDNAKHFLALLHEIGHALGFSHPFTTTGETRYTAPLSIYEDGPNTTVMSYDLLTGSMGAPGVGVPTTPMPYDILAMQYLYGANTTHNATDTVYSFDVSNVRMETIWDAGGSDTIVATNKNALVLFESSPTLLQGYGHRGAQIDLRAGKGLDPVPDGVFGGQSGNRIGFVGEYAANALNLYSPGQLPYGHGYMSDFPNIFIAFGVTIENAIGTDQNDKIIGNEANNHLTGGGGSDQIDGQGGTDTALYLEPASNYTISKTTAGFDVSANFTVNLTPPLAYGGPALAPYRYIDKLQNIERIEFKDKGIAYDLATGQAASNTAKLIGAMLDTAYLTPAYTTLGLNLFDSGKTMLDVAQIVLNTGLFQQLAGSRSNADLVKLLFNNLGVAATAGDVAYYKGLLDKGTLSQAQLVVNAADSSFNATNINLVGLQSTGIEYTHG